jgi:hypothetical protein
MEKVKSILNPGYKETDSILYDVSSSKKKGSKGSQPSSPTATDPIASEATASETFNSSHADTTAQTTKDAQGHARYDSAVGTGDNYKHTAAEQQAPISEESHFGRDAAIGAGAVGATGLAAHEYNHPHGSHGATSLQQNPADRTFHSNQGQQQQGVVSEGFDHHGNQGSAVAGDAPGHHYGRDAAIGAGAVGAAGAVHEHQKHDQESMENNTKEGKPGILKRIFKHGDKHEKDDAGVAAVGAHEGSEHHHHDSKHYETPASQNVIDSNTVPTEVNKDHHYGRDAALGAGVVGAGAAAYHHHEKKNTETAPIAANQTTQQAAVNEPQKEHHYARDAAVGAGTVGAGKAVHHHHHEKEDTTTEHKPKERKPSIIKRIFKRGSRDGDAMEDNAETEDDHHYGRDAALGAGAVGMGAAAVHHHNQNNRRNDEELGIPADQKLYTNPEVKRKEHNIASQVLNPHGDKVDPIRYGTTASTQEPAHQESDLPAQKKEHNLLRKAIPHHGKHDAAHTSQSSSTEQTNSNHFGRDATLAAGAAGTAGYAAHEHQKHKTTSPLHAERDTAGMIEPTSTPAVHSGSPTAATRTTRDNLPTVEDDGGRFMSSSDLSQGASAGAGHNVAAGVGSGAAVAAAQKAYKDHDAVNSDTSPISPTSTTSMESGPATKTQGPHKSNILNILDPRVRPDFQQMKANKESKNESVNEEPSPAAVAAASTALGSSSKHTTSSHHPDVAKEQLTSSQFESNQHSSGTVDNKGIVTGERGIVGDSGNPYSSAPLDPRVNMPGSYPAATPTEK